MGSVSTVSASTMAPSADMEPSQSTTAELLVRTFASVLCSLKRLDLLAPLDCTPLREPPLPWARHSQRRESWTWTELLLRPFRRRRSEHTAVLRLDSISWTAGFLSRRID